MWVVKKALEEYVDENILVGDSTIAICWASNDKQRLSLFHRNRLIEIRRGTPIEQIFHCPDKYKEEDVGPATVWELGKPWMKQPMNVLIDNVSDTNALSVFNRQCRSLSIKKEVLTLTFLPTQRITSSTCESPSENVYEKKEAQEKSIMDLLLNTDIIYQL